jgi:hypothetical protein
MPLRGARRPVFAVHADGWFGRRMLRAGWLGFTLPLPFVTIVFFWLRPGQQPERAVLIHEATHAIQVEEHGVVRFVVTYLWDLLRRGYSDNRYETSARRADREVVDLDADLLRKFVT